MAGFFWPPFSFKLALPTCTIFLYFRFSERLSLSNIMCSLIGYSSNDIMLVYGVVWSIVADNPA